MSFPDFLGRLNAIFDDIGLDYMIVGSLASTLHGIGRSTQDIDIVVELSLGRLQDLQRQRDLAGKPGGALSSSEHTHRPARVTALRGYTHGLARLLHRAGGLPYDDQPAMERVQLLVG